MKILNKKAIVFFFCIFVLLVFCAPYGFILRNNLKNQCGAGMDCNCFDNIVDNRLSKKQIRGFTKFLGEIKKRSSANILEFLDEEEAQALSRVLSICRLNNIPDNQGSLNRD